jgi:hypothetical protein
VNSCDITPVVDALVDTIPSAFGRISQPEITDFREGEILSLSSQSRGALLLVEVFQICDFLRKNAIGEHMSLLPLHRCHQDAWSVAGISDFVARREQWGSLFSDEIETADEAVHADVGHIVPSCPKFPDASSQRVFEGSHELGRDGRWIAGNRGWSRYALERRVKGAQGAVRLSRGRKERIEANNSALSQRIVILKAYFVRSQEAGVKLCRESTSRSSDVAIRQCLYSAERLFAEVAIIPAFPFVRQTDEGANDKRFNWDIERIIETEIGGIAEKARKSIPTTTTQILINGS